MMLQNARKLIRSEKWKSKHRATGAHVSQHSFIVLVKMVLYVCKAVRARKQLCPESSRSVGKDCLEDNGSSRMTTASKKLAAMMQERGASAKRTEADLRKGLKSSSFQEPSAPVKPAALFSCGSEETGNQFKSSFFKHADPSNLGRSLLEGNEDHLLSQARSELVRQEHYVESLNNCISEVQ